MTGFNCTVEELKDIRKETDGDANAVLIAPIDGIENSVSLPLWV